MKQIVLEVLETLTEEKKAAKRFPSYVIDVDLKKEIWKRINSSLRELKSEGKLRIGNSFNHKFVELIETKK